MRKLFLSLFFFAALFSSSFYAARFALKPIAPSSSQMQVDPFRAAAYPLQFKSFVIAVIGRNNGAALQKTVDSIFSQAYDNYRVVYIDDASDDGSFELAQDLINNNPRMVRVDQVHNEAPLGHVANLSRIVKECLEDEILVVLEGEDWLAHEWVLQRINAYYADPDVWLMLGQAVDFPTFEMSTIRPFQSDKQIRSQLFVAAPLKTFYAALFKKIKESDFVYQGKVVKSSSEFAYMIPMLEMAKGHFHYVSEVLYIANQHRMQFDDREGLVRVEKWVKSLPAYEPLVSLFDVRESSL